VLSDFFSVRLFAGTLNISLSSFIIRRHSFLEGLSFSMFLSSSCLKTPLLVLGGGFNEACVSTTPLLVLGVGFNEACVSTTFGSVLAIKARIWSIVLSLSAPSSVEVCACATYQEDLDNAKVIL